MKYYEGDGRDTNVDIPTAQGDPNLNFWVGSLVDNCYAYALNLYGIGSINPGFTTGSRCTAALPGTPRSTTRAGTTG